MKATRVMPVLCVVVAAMLGATPVSAHQRRDPTLPVVQPCAGCWLPDPQTTWQWQLTGDLDTSVDVQMYDVDLFETSAATVDLLHGDGRAIVCYISAGSRERWRPDAGDYPRRVLGRPLDGWPGEKWVDVRKWGVLGPILRDRLDLCAAKGFDGVEFDNVDGYQNHSGFRLHAADQALFDARLANEAHLRGLSAALKNDLGQVATLLPYFDFALNEECFTYHECDRLTPFVDASKAVFQVEYALSVDAFCPKAAALGFNAMKKHLALGVWRQAC